MVIIQSFVNSKNAIGLMHCKQEVSSWWIQKWTSAPPGGPLGLGTDFNYLQ